MSHHSVEDRFAITDGIHRFYRLVDMGRAFETAKLFTSNATLTFGPGSPNPGTIEGDAISAAMKLREEQKLAFTRHAVANVAFDAPLDDDGGRVTYLLTLYRSDDETRSSIPAFVADVEERWERREGQWLIAARTILPTFARAE